MCDVQIQLPILSHSSRRPHAVLWHQPADRRARHGADVATFAGARAEAVVPTGPGLSSEFVQEKSKAAAKVHPASCGTVLGRLCLSRSTQVPVK